jgi:hypothetical protein
MTVEEADFFDRESTRLFLSGGRDHLLAGGNPNALIHVHGVEYNHDQCSSRFVHANGPSDVSWLT